MTRRADARQTPKRRRNPANRRQSLRILSAHPQGPDFAARPAQGVHWWGGDFDPLERNTRPSCSGKSRWAPGWSSLRSGMARMLFTQDQRGPKPKRKRVGWCATSGFGQGENLENGFRLDRWTIRWAVLAKRATPTMAIMARFTSSAARSILRLVNPVTGERNCLEEKGAEPRLPIAKSFPLWGFSSSPLGCFGTVVVFMGGAPRGRKEGLLAFEPLWRAPLW